MVAGFYTLDRGLFRILLGADQRNLVREARASFAREFRTRRWSITVEKCPLGLTHVLCNGKRVGYITLSLSRA